MPIALHGTSSVWSETLLTWNNRPATGTRLGTIRVVNATPQWYEWDVTAYVRAEKAAGRRFVSFRLSNDTRTVAVLEPQLANSREQQTPAHRGRRSLTTKYSPA